MLFATFVLAITPAPWPAGDIPAMRCRVVLQRLAEFTLLGRGLVKRRTELGKPEDKPRIEALTKALEENEALIAEADRYFGALTPAKADLDAFEGLAVPELRAELRRCIDQHKE